MIKIAVVDDNQYHIDDVKRLLAKNVENISYEVFEYLRADSFLVAINSEQFDIVFLDIVMDKANGIEIGLLLNEKQPNTNIIFISSNEEYFKDVYKVTHSYFLTKDFEESRFSDAVTKALKNIQRDLITVDTKDGKCKIILNDVIYFEGGLKHTRAYMSDGEMIEYSVNLKEIESLLPEKDFLRTHQNFIINMNHIKKYSKQMLFMAADKSVPISRLYVNTVREKITLFLGGVI